MGLTPRLGKLGTRSDSTQVFIFIIFHVCKLALAMARQAIDFWVYQKEVVSLLCYHVRYI